MVTAFLLKLMTTRPGHLFPGPTANSFAAASPQSKVCAMPAGTDNAAVAAAESFKNDLREIFIGSP
jgi:hypothetical protein